MAYWDPNHDLFNQGYEPYSDTFYTDNQGYRNSNFNDFYTSRYNQNYSQNAPPNFFPVQRNYDSRQFTNTNNEYTQESSISNPNPSSNVRYSDTSTSTLTPTAEEFRPRNATYPNVDSSNGAVKKLQTSRNKKPNNGRYGQGTWHNSSKQNGDKKYQERNDNSNFSRPKKKGYVNKNNDPVNVAQESESYRQNNEQVAEKDKEQDSIAVQRDGDRPDYSKVNNFERNYGYYRKDIQFNRSNGKNQDVNKKYNKNISQNYQKKFEEKYERYPDRNKDNWRQIGSSANGKAVKKVNNFRELNKKLDAASQRERLQQMVERRLLECLVCCDHMRHTEFIWSCKHCYHILHLDCVSRWAKTSKLEAGWRCPACQHTYADIPNEYRCYCEKVLQPRLDPNTLPHSCGEICGRKGRTCEHTCTLLCHPGPCPDCTVMIAKPCGCGATKPIVKCTSDIPIICQNICGKLLKCGLHKCVSTCHHGDCDNCSEILKQECYCGKQGRKVACSADVNGTEHYQCEDLCGKLLSCGNHTCEEPCHPGDCPSCTTSPALITTCHCGQTKLEDERKSCLDVIPCCDKICNKALKCGQPSSPHRCKKSCHEGACPPCTSTTMVRCRCGHMDKELPCTELTSKADDARCQKKCTKKRLCTKHRCNQLCCIEVEHICPLPCNHTLSCGLHRCEATCHRGRCPPCWRTSFEELFCECGASVLYPPIACGTRPPTCREPCSRGRDCGHEPYHNCHTGSCPPCTVLCKKWCYGNHEQRSTIPCHQKEFSCGLPCNKDMACGRHKCIQPCHAGACPEVCMQPCNTMRTDCEHTCNQPCHEPPCPDVPCRQTVTVFCQCGLRHSTRACMELSGEYQNIAMSQLISKMADIQNGLSVDISNIGSNCNKHGPLKTLECNNDCKLVERNRRLAIGLQIRNPDLNAKLTPRYSDFLRNWAKKDSRFCQHVHDKLTDLVQLAKQSKQKSRSYSFETMNRDKRHFVHEYCEHFGCSTEAYDAEPNRNVVATAFKDKSWLPSFSLLECLQRESGIRKVPGPILGTKKLPLRPVRPSTPPPPTIDYFNDPPV